MGLLTFKGGLHPYEGKELSNDKPITEYLPQGELVYPLSQHIGAPAVACVKKGDRVLVGQKIAEAGGFVSANIYSSVSGTVKKIEPRMTVSGNKVNSIIVENDGEYKEVEYAPVHKPVLVEGEHGLQPADEHAERARADHIAGYLKRLFLQRYALAHFIISELSGHISYRLTVLFYMGRVRFIMT